MIFQIFTLHSSMLKSIKSNNSPGHSHNRLPSVVDLSIDSCPGIILKRNNKMNEHEEKIDILREAILLVEEACQLVDSVMDDSTNKSHYEAYGKLGFSRLLGNGNPEDSSIYTEIEELEKESELAEGKKTMKEIYEHLEAVSNV